MRPDTLMYRQPRRHGTGGWGKGSTTRKTALLALLALLTHAFFVRWVRPLSDALLKADVKRRGGSEDEVKGGKERGKKFSRRTQIFGACPLTDRVDLRQPSHTSSTHTL